MMTDSQHSASNTKRLLRCVKFSPGLKDNTFEQQVLSARGKSDEPILFTRPPGSHLMASVANHVSDWDVVQILMPIPNLVYVFHYSTS